MSIKRSFIAVSMLFFVGSWFAGVARAQGTTGTVSGRITDTSGAVVPGTDVKLQSMERGTISTTTTNNAGIYVFPSVEPGQYHITIFKPGFKQIDLPSVIVNIQSHIEQNFRLEVGSISESVTVEAGAPLIDTQTATVSTVINRQFVENLPMNGQSFQSLIELTPGMTPAVASQYSQGQFTANGQRANSNYYTVDGVSANFGGASTQIMVNAGGSLPGLSAEGGTNTLVSIDDIQEFRIQTSTFAPEFGRTPGAQIAVETRSGTNHFHGNVFEYFRNTSLDAGSWFNGYLGLPKPAEHTNDFGGILGGPIYRNKAFFFFSYEGQRLLLPETAQTEVPALNARIAAPAPLQPFLNAFPIPNGPPLTDGSLLAPYNGSYSDPSSLNSYSIRIDDSLSNWRFFGRYSNAPSTATTGGPEQGLSINTYSPAKYKTQALTAGATWVINSHTTNDLRFNYGYSQTFSNFYLNSTGGAIRPPDSVLFPPTQPYNSSNGSIMFVASETGIDTVFHVGKIADNTQTQYNVVDNFSLEKGTHELKFGVDYRRLSPHFDPANYSLVPAYLTLPALVANQLFYALTESQRGGLIYIHNLGTYAQDTWRATPRLTLTYGLRWDVDFTPTLSNGLHFLSVTGFGGNGSNLAIASAGTPIYKTTYGNFAPRLGLNYQLNQTQGHEAVLRGGFGVFYDLVSQDVGLAVTTYQYPFGSRAIIYGPGAGGTATFPLTPAEAVPPSITLAPPLFFATVINPNLKLPYTYEYNVALEQALGNNQSLSASYVGATGRRLLQTSVGPTTNAVFPSADVTDNTSTSNYNALQLQFKRQVTQGLQAIAAYTWSHSIDTASTDSGAGNDDFVILGQNPNVNRGPSDFDIRNSGSLGLTYTLPKLTGGFLRRNLLGGWSVETLVLAYSAAPLTVIDNNLVFPNEPGVAVRPDVIPGQPFYIHGSKYPGGKALNPAAFKDPPTTIVGGVPSPVRQGTLGRNSLRGFGVKQWDFSVHRDFILPKTLDLQFRAEAFNVINHPNFGGVNTSFTTPLQPTFGQSTETYAQALGTGGLGGGFNPLFQIGGPRSIQLAMKLMF